MSAPVLSTVGTEVHSHYVLADSIFPFKSPTEVHARSRMQCG